MAQGIPDVLNGVAPEPGATDDPFEGTELADAGSYQSVTFADSGPIPESVAVPSSGAPLAEPAPAASAATPSAAGDARPSTVATTAPAPVAQTAASTPPAAASTAVAAAPARVQAAPDLRPATPPKLIRGSILNSDNRRGAYQGTVSVRFTVGTSGRATGCTPTASSGNFRLDAYTCELVQQRLQFTPAVTAQGRPVPAEMRATYNWGRKRRTLTGRLLDIVR
jgi:protein TonB